MLLNQNHEGLMGVQSNKIQGRKKAGIHFSLIIFFVILLFTVSLWDAYFNGSRPLDQSLASILILIMGSLFAIAAGLFSWSVESRRNFLEREVERRTSELADKNRELELKKEEVENFIHIISHDLKAPIVSIQGFAAILKSEIGATLKGENADYFNRISVNAKQMNTLIADLLEFSRVGRIEDEKSEIDTEEIIREILITFRPELDKRHIEVEVSERMPKLWGPSKRFHQVMSNLIGNAVKYMGSPAAPKIEIGAKPSDLNCVEIWVKDNGIGIKKDYHEKIFQMFQRAPNQLREEGTGIGLSIVKKIVELNGGKVWLESEEGKGSQFFVKWPISTACNAQISALEKNGSTVS